MQGLLLLDKPNGITSFSAVRMVKHAAGEKRVGHTGTLDPMATGVLPVLVGRATALSSLMLDKDKCYIATARLGITTDTDDITGEVLTKTDVNISNEDIENVLNKFLGRQKQIPPMFSAIKQNGVRLYKLAREGKTADIPERDIEIYSIEILSVLDGNNEFSFKAHVSKGTYIRSLVRDIGECLGVGATLSSLKRTNASGFDIKECVNPEILTESNISDYILSEEKAVEYLPQISVTEKQAIRFCNGGQLGYDRLNCSSFPDGQLLRVKFNGLFLGVGIADNENKQINIKCVINYPKGEQR